MTINTDQVALLHDAKLLVRLYNYEKGVAKRSHRATLWYLRALETLAWTLS